MCYNIVIKGEIQGRKTDMSQRTVTKRVVGYCRVSTDKQADGGVSLDAQTEKIRQYAALYDLHLVDIIIDAGEVSQDT